ncbi:response regulator [Humibacter antri]
MRLVIAEDETLLRRGLRLVLESEGFTIESAMGDAVGLLNEVAQLRPDLVVTDIRMPPTHTDEGLVAALRIKKQFPDVAVIVLSQYVQRLHVRQLMEAAGGKVGYLLKQRIGDVDAFCRALRRVAAGGVAFDPEVIAVMVARAQVGDDGVRSLTPRQRAVLALMAEGRSNAGIATRLTLTEKSVVQHVSNIYDTLGLPVDSDDHRRVLAVVRYLAQ